MGVSRRRDADAFRRRPDRALFHAHRHPGDSNGRDLSDREASYVAAHYLREQLEQEDERPLHDVSAADVTRIIGQLCIQ
jgi:hypothetical protein